VATLERIHFILGLHQEVVGQYNHYTHLLRELMQLEAQVEITERSLRVMRDHMLEAIQDCECPEGELPEGTAEMFHHMRFIGRRAAEACLEVLREKKTLTVNELLEELNQGMFRFRTASPEREINAALLRQPHVKREDDRWIYVGPAEEKPSEKEVTAA
jgi:hypothetical protein